jgi:hypothetical protein
MSTLPQPRSFLTGDAPLVQGPPEKQPGFWSQFLHALPEIAIGAMSTPEHYSAYRQSKLDTLREQRLAQQEAEQQQMEQEKFAQQKQMNDEQLRESNRQDTERFQQRMYQIRQDIQKNEPVDVVPIAKQMLSVSGMEVPADFPHEMKVRPDVADNYVTSLVQAAIARQKAQNPDTGSSDAERFARLHTKIQAGTATPEDKLMYEGLSKYRTQVTQESFALSNPPADQDYVKWAADQLLQPGGEKLRTEILGTNKTLQDQVQGELAKRGLNLEQLTTTNRQMGETAQVLIPKFRAAVKMLDSPALRAKLGPVSGRWNDFMAGKVGSGDPDLVRLRATIALLKTGTLRAHMGARGGQSMLAYFDNLLNSSRMDAPTLKTSLNSISDFLQGYADQLTRDTGNPAAPDSNDPLRIR